MRCKGVGSHPSPPPLSGLCSLPQHGEGQAGAPSPGPGRPPQDVKKIFSKQPGGRLGLALTPSFVEAFPSFLLSSHSWLRQGPPLAAPSFSSTVTQASLACPGKWWCIDYCLLGLMRGSGQDPWTPLPGPTHRTPSRLRPSLHWLETCRILPPGVGGTRALELGGPASLGGIPGEQGGPRKQTTQGLFFFWANLEQICLLACGGCARHEEVRGDWWVSLEIPTVEILTWPPVCPSHWRKG